LKIFYSWQSDLEPKYNRNFIKDCLDTAIKKINNDLIISEAVRLDQDTKDVAGIPDIANTVFSKIKKSDIFLGDISFITTNDKQKKCPNPNVMIELGYALCSLTDSYIINIMNTAYGDPEGNLPFDLRHKRWPIAYRLNVDNYDQKAEIKKILVKTILSAIIPILKKRIVDNKISSISLVNMIQTGEVGKRILFNNLNQLYILSEIREIHTSLIKISVTCMDESGKKNKEFGNSGKVVLDFFGSENSQVGQILSDKIGSIYVIGHSVSDKYFDIVICKLLANGHYDNSYGTNGIARASLGNSNAYTNSAVINTDGSIISVGHQYETKKLLLCKFNASGELDNSFGERGFVSLSLSNEHDWGVDLQVIAPENKIVVLLNSGCWQPSVIRLNHDGSIDRSFGAGGISYFSEFLGDFKFLQAQSVAVQDDGKLLIAGFGNEGIIIRLHSDGKLDTSFAESGIRITRSKFRTGWQKVLIGNDGRIFVAGEQGDGNSVMTGVIASFEKNGSINSKFGDDGFVFLSRNKKEKITDMALIKAEKLAVIGEENAMSNGYETTFLEVLSLNDFELNN
jgi:uncharacterized delta-60 repeat protein